MPVETGWIKQKTVVAPDLDTAIECFENHLDATYSVAWIDCLATGSSRGCMTRETFEQSYSTGRTFEVIDTKFKGPALMLDAAARTENAGICIPDRDETR
jgi:hypothetical protein